jgi:hypothetical protein
VTVVNGINKNINKNGINKNWINKNAGTSDNMHGVKRHNAVIFIDVVFKNKSHFTCSLVAISTVEHEEGCERKGLYYLLKETVFLLIVA